MRKSDLPVCEHVVIEKQASRSGDVKILDALGNWRRNPFLGSLPFSKFAKFEKYSTKNESKGDRNDYFEKVVKELIQAKGSDRHPIRFRDANRVAWKGDKGAVPWLLATKRFALDGNDIVWLNAPSKAALEGQSIIDAESSERRKEYYERLSRPKQAELRRTLLYNLGVCCISGCTTSQMLEAAHIVPVKEGGNESPSNAILLRADLHRLFDFGLLRINPNNGIIWFAPDVNNNDVETTWRYGSEADLPPLELFRARWET